MPLTLYCDETKERIKYGDVLIAGTRQDVEIFSALSKEAIERIPECKRHCKPCKTGDGGIDIHRAISSENPDGYYTWFGLEIDRFLFSISKETAKKYLPNHHKHIIKKIIS